MNISFDEGSAQSKAPPRSKTKASASKQQQAESSMDPTASQPAPPSSNLTAEIRRIITSALQESFGSLQITQTAQYHEFSSKVESEIGKLVDSVTRIESKVDELEHNTVTIGDLDTVDKKVENMYGHFEDWGNKFDNMFGLYNILHDKMNLLLKGSSTSGPSTSAPPPTHSPLHSPIHLSPQPSPHKSPPTSQPASTPTLSPSHLTTYCPDPTPSLPSAPPTVPFPTPVEFQDAPSSSSGDTADLFDEHPTPDVSSHPPTLPLPAHEYTDRTPHFESLIGKSSFTPVGIPDPTIINPTPLSIIPPPLDDDKGGEVEKEQDNEEKKKKIED